MAETKTKASRQSVYDTLSAVDVSKHLEVKGQGRFALKYLSWAYAWGILKKYYPDTPTPVNREFPEYAKDPQTGKMYATGRDVDYRLTNAGCEVQATITIEGNDYTCSLYVMDNRNRVVHNPDLAQINKTQMRCWVKCLALAGLGLNVYASEDLPIDKATEDVKKEKPQQSQQNKQNFSQTQRNKELAELEKKYKDLRQSLSGKLKKKPGLVESAVLKQATTVKGWKEMKKPARYQQMIDIMATMLQAG